MRSVYFKYIVLIALIVFVNLNALGYKKIIITDTIITCEKWSCDDEKYITKLLEIENSPDSLKLIKTFHLMQYCGYFSIVDGVKIAKELLNKYVSENRIEKNEIYYNLMGLYYQLIHDNEKSLTNYRIAYNMFANKKDTHNLIDMNSKMGVTFMKMGKIGKASGMFLKSVPIAEKTKDYELLTKMNYNVCALYFRLEFYTLSTYTANRGLRSPDASKSDYLYKRLLHVKVDAMLERGKLDSALNKIERLEKYYHQKGYQYAFESCNSSKALYYEKLKQYRKSEKYYTKFYNYVKQHDFGDTYVYVLLYSKLANVYYHLKKYDKSKEFCYKLINLNNKPPAIFDYIKVYKILSNIYKSSGNTKNAIHNLERYRTLKDSLSKVRVKMLRDVIKENIAYSKSKITDKYIIEQNKKSELVVKMNNYKSIFITIVISLLLCILIYTIYITRKSRNQYKVIKRLNEINNKIDYIATNNIIPQLQLLTEINRELLNINKEDKEYFNLVFKSFNVSNRIRSAVEKIILWSGMNNREIELSGFSLFSMLNIIKTNFSPIIKNKNLDIIILNSDNIKNINIKSDREIVQFVLNNIISNAIKYSYPNSNIEVGTTINKKKLVVSIKDSGIGIDNKIKSKLFKEHFAESTLGTNGELGLGIGLFLSNIYIQKLEGELYMNKSESGGCEFSFIIPHNMK